MQRTIKYLLCLSITLYACTKKETIVQNTLDPANTVTDIDGNRYPTIKIGDQIIMAANLRVSRYRNGDAIQHVKDNTEWSKLNNSKDSGAWCNYENNAEYDRIYGKLYNFYAVNDPRGLAPKGWHVLDTAGYNKLITALGGNADTIGRALKATILWDIPNDANNSSGFSALPGGYRDVAGPFNLLESECHFWLAKIYNNYAYQLILTKDASVSIDLLGRDFFRGGLSVVCVKD